MKSILIEANHISKIYDPNILWKRGKNEYALRSVDFILEEGDFISVMGPSGSGKTTLINCITTLDKISKGHLKLFGRDTLAIKDTIIDDFRNKYLGFIFQNHNLIPSLSIYDNIAVPLLLNEVSNDEIDNKIKKVTKDLNIEKILDKKPYMCSGGECQRVAIARAIIQQPKIIVCDEPTGNLDSKNSHEVLRILSDMNKKGITIVLVTHDPLIASYSKKMMYLYDGSIINVVNRNSNNQVDFYHKIVNVTSKDSDIQRVLNNEEYIELNKEMFNKRTDVYMMISDREYDDKLKEQYRPLIIDDEYMIYINVYQEKVKISLSIIKGIKIDLISKTTGIGIFSDYLFYVNVDFVCDDMVLRFKAMNQDDMIDVIEKLEILGYDIEDKKNIKDIFYKYPLAYERGKYLRNTYKELLK